MSQALRAADFRHFPGCDKLSQAPPAAELGLDVGGNPPSPPKCGTRTFIFCKPALFQTNATG